MMALTGGNGAFAKGSFKTREARFKGAGTLKTRLEQRETALQKQREAFAASLSPPSKKEGPGK